MSLGENKKKWLRRVFYVFLGLLLFGVVYIAYLIWGFYMLHQPTVY